MIFCGGLTLGGCYAEEQATVTYSGGAEVDASPDLVEVSPGVQVIADYNEPVFFSDGYYWRVEGGVWYQSRDYRSGWSHVRNVPEHVSRISAPEHYRHYRPTGWHPRTRETRKVVHK